MATRIVIWSLIATGVLYDIACVACGWPTISQGVRELDQQSGQLVRWLWLALWFHFFVLMPNASQFYGNRNA